MKVREVKAIVKEWVDLNASKEPGFLGAHFMGSINRLPDDAEFAFYRDVDIHIVLEEKPEQRRQLELLYKGLMLEAASHAVEGYTSDAVLANASLAPEMAAGSIISDPQGILGALHQIVAKEYPRRQWVLKRCAMEKEAAYRSLDAAGQQDSPIEAALELAWAAGWLVGIIPVAHLVAPTHRRCLVLLHELLSQDDRLDLHETLLEHIGLSDISRQEAQEWLVELGRAFDYAVAVHKTPVRFANKLYPHLRPYVIEASQEMIDEGYHREAMSYIRAMLLIYCNAIQVDAPEEAKGRYMAEADRLLARSRLSTPGQLGDRIRETRELAPRFFELADEIVARNPQVID